MVLPLLYLSLDASVVPLSDAAGNVPVTGAREWCLKCRSLIECEHATAGLLNTATDSLKRCRRRCLPCAPSLAATKEAEEPGQRRVQ